MAKFILNDSSTAHYLEVEYKVRRKGKNGRVKTKTEVKRLPLADSFSLDDSMSFVRANNAPKKKRDKAMFRWCYEFFCRHLGREFVGSLTQEQIIALSNRWIEASNEVDTEAGGATLGE